MVQQLQHEQKKLKNDQRDFDQQVEDQRNEAAIKLQALYKGYRQVLLVYTNTRLEIRGSKTQSSKLHSFVN